jgi:hypothetical protein
MKEKNDKIRAYLNQESPEYWEGVELYTNHPDARKNIVISLNQQSNKGFMHEKLIYELENIAGIAVHSNRSSVMTHRAAVIPYKIVDEVKLAAPVNYEYKTKLEKLPQELKSLVIEKGQLYGVLEESKKELAKIGQENDEKSIDLRNGILRIMQDVVIKIKNIHLILIRYDETSEIVLEDLSTFYEKSDEVIDLSNASEEDILDNEFKFKKMDHYQKKDLLVRLRSSVVKQEQRAAESKKPDVVKKNSEKAELGRKMIAWLEKYFEEN